MTFDPDHDPLWERVHDVLDRNADPLEDARVIAALSERPEALAELLRLRESLARIAPRAVARTPSRTRRVAAAAAALVLVGAALNVTRMLPMPVHAPTTVPPVARTLVVDFELSISTTSAAGTRTLVLDPRGSLWRHESAALVTTHHKGTMP